MFGYDVGLFFFRPGIHHIFPMYNEGFLWFVAVYDSYCLIALESVNSIYDQFYKNSGHLEFSRKHSALLDFVVFLLFLKNSSFMCITAQYKLEILMPHTLRKKPYIKRNCSAYRLYHLYGIQNTLFGLSL